MSEKAKDNKIIDVIIIITTTTMMILLGINVMQEVEKDLALDGRNFQIMICNNITEDQNITIQYMSGDFKQTGFLRNHNNKYGYVQFECKKAIKEAIAMAGTMI